MRGYAVTHAIQIGCDMDSSQQAIDLARGYPDVFRATVGIHPNECDKYDISYIENMIKNIDRMIQENRDYVVGIGETGLDFHYLPDDSLWDRERQRISWKLQSELARHYALPLIIHSRDARDETLDFIRENRLNNIIMHCYSENLLLAQEILDIVPEVYFSFSGIITYPKSNAIQEAAKYLPLERILVETDAPFLSPQPVRGTVNEPANVRYVLEKLCDLRDEPAELIEHTVYANSKRVYGL